MTDTLRAGMSTRDITPPAGKPMAAFPAGREPMQPRIAEGAHDPLIARAVALANADTTLVICVADVVSFQWCDVDRMRAAFAERTGLPGDSLVVAGTHNHNGPECTYMFAGSPDDPYIAHMREQVVAAAAEAVAGLAPARLSVAAVEADIVHNRRKVLPDGRFQQVGRNPTRERIGPVDPRVTVLRFDGQAGRIAALLHFAAHPVIMQTPNRLFTAEYPGAARRTFEATTGVGDCLFLQGACGDTHPYQGGANDYEAVEEMGRDLAQAGAAASEQAVAESGVTMTVERWRDDVPHRTSPQHRVRLEVTALALSPRLAMVFWQGEPFVELSLALQWRSPFARTIVAGYSLGWIGYVPTRQAYEFGGYGVDAYDIDPPEFCRTGVPPGTGELLVDQTAQVLEGLKHRLPG